MEISGQVTTVDNDARLFPGLRPSPGVVPDYLLERMQPLFEVARLCYAAEVSKGRTPDWCVHIRRDTCWTPRNVEWADYQADEGELNPPIYFERYGYTEGLDAFTVSVIDPQSGATNLSWANQLFAFLNDDSLLRNGFPEEVGHMGTYSIIRRECDIPGIVK